MTFALVSRQNPNCALIFITLEEQVLGKGCWTIMTEIIGALFEV